MRRPASFKYIIILALISFTIFFTKKRDYSNKEDIFLISDIDIMENVPEINNIENISNINNTSNTPEINNINNSSKTDVINDVPKADAIDNTPEINNINNSSKTDIINDVPKAGAIDNTTKINNTDNISNINNISKADNTKNTPKIYDFENSIERVCKKSSYRLYPTELNKSRKLLGELIGENHTENGKLKYPSLYVKKYCRLGNNILQLSSAIYLAEVFNVSTIYIEKDFCFINNTITTSKGIKIIPTKQAPQESLSLERVLFGLKYKKHYGEKRACIYNPEDRVYEFANETLKSIPKVSTDDNALYIHIRSGDIFKRYFNPWYGQPPLCYYEGVITKWGFEDVYIIAEDTRNPVINKLIQKYDAKLIKTDLLQTIGYVVSAKNLALSFGTFAPSLLRLVPEDLERRLFRYGIVKDCLGDAWKNYYFTNISKYYSSNILYGRWNNTDEQKQIMLNETCGETWKFFVYSKN